jgi:hypothetical protein
MAGKNQKRIRAALNKKGNTDGIAIMTPNHGYHNNSGGLWTTRRIAPVGGKTVYKKKAKSFPQVGKPLSMAEQRKLFYGASFIS